MLQPISLLCLLVKNVKMSVVDITQSDLTSGFFRIVHIIKGLLTNMHYPSDADLCPIYRWKDSCVTMQWDYIAIFAMKHLACFCI